MADERDDGHYIGFKPLRSGCIHMWCPVCKRRFSNMPRTEHDPRRAVLLQLTCPRCPDMGAKDDYGVYLDARGRYCG